MLVEQQLLLKVTQPFMIEARNDVFLRLYPDSRPHCLEIAALQKGLVLVLNGRELIEEGVGFGVPVVKFEDKTYFSSSASTYLRKSDSHLTLIKSFFLDCVSRKRFKKGPFIDDGFYSLLRGVFERAYLRRKRFTPFFDKIMELRNVLEIKTDFVKVKPRGNITVRYSFFPKLVRVEADFSGLDWTGCEEVLILNEQGSVFFRRYLDSDGLELLDGQIGAWEQVEAEEASLSDAKETLTFTLKNKGGAKLYRGYERVKGRFSWTGLNYSLMRNSRLFSYEIDLR